MLNVTNTRWAVLAGLIGLALIVGGVSFLYTPGSSANRTSSEIGRIVGLANGQMLYIATLEENESHGGGPGIDGSDLIVLDSQTGESRVIAKEVWTAQFSPDGKEIVAADSDNKVRLYSVDGSLKAQIGNNGASPIFTHDGKFIAYHKLADEGEEFFKLAENAKGIALYEIATGEERMLTNHSGDYWPIGFSADFKYFYFNADRPYESSILGENVINITSGLYSLDVSTGRVTRLTNADERAVQENGQTMSFITHDALWTSDRLIAITGLGQHGTYKFTFDGAGGLKSVERVSSGDAPRWVEQDKSFETRTVVDGKETWNATNIK